ncbi:inclusion body family protein [Trinickia sp. LjRoot230]|uniref:AidA/PixA family protein n=1 Tax=Trinickia sp. LjRoot230 TaxID=3342288 RepID=UPI003ECCD2B9
MGGMMSNIIDVLIAVDCESIIAGYGENNAPTNPPMMEYESLYMVIRNGNNLNYNKSPYLYLKATAENDLSAASIRWRMRALSMGFGYQAFLTNFVLYDGVDIITQPENRELRTKALIPDKTNPDQLNSQEVVDNFWESTVLRPGYVAYFFYLAIVDHTGKVRGYYRNDPAVVAQ